MEQKPKLLKAITIEWDPNPKNEQVTHYNVYYGSKSILCGFPAEKRIKVKGTCIAIYDPDIMVEGKTTYFVITAANKYLSESGFSNEITFTPEYKKPEPQNYESPSGCDANAGTMSSPKKLNPKENSFYNQVWLDPISRFYVSPHGIDTDPGTIENPKMFHPHCDPEHQYKPKKEEWQEREYFTQMSNLSSVMVHGSPGQVKVKVIDDLRYKHCGK